MSDALYFPFSRCLDQTMLKRAVLLYDQIYRDLPVAKDGWIELPDRPGFGFEPDWDRIDELARRPLSRGTGKA